MNNDSFRISEVKVFQQQVKTENFKTNEMTIPSFEEIKTPQIVALVTGGELGRKPCSRFLMGMSSSS